MHIITVASRKGGVGKTTTAGGVSQGLAQAGHRVALIDLDSQFNAASMFLKRVAKEFRVEEWLNGGEPRWSEATAMGGAPFQLLHGVGAHPGLEPAELKARLQGLDFDYVVFDCPPSDAKIVRSAVAIADTVLALAEPGDWALAGALAIEKMVSPEQRLTFVVSRYGGDRRRLEGMCISVLNTLPYETFTVANDSKVPVSAAGHAGFPRRGKASMDMFELVEFLQGGK